MQRRTAIINAARKLFFEKGFKSVTVENIAKKAELSKGSIYLYYNSKEEIYTQILLNDIDKFNKKSANLFTEGKSVEELVIDFGCVYIDFFLSDRELFRIMMNFMLHTDNMNLTDDVNQHIIEVTNNTVKIIENILQKGIDKGDLPADIPVRQCRNAIWGLLNGVISLHLFTGKEMNKEERIRKTIKSGMDVFIKGLRLYKKSDEMIYENPNLQTI